MKVQFHVEKTAILNPLKKKQEREFWVLEKRINI